MKRIMSVILVVILMLIILLYAQVHIFVPAQTQENEVPQGSCNNFVQKDRDGRTEYPEADKSESIPNPAGEAAVGDDSHALREEEKKVLLAYTEYLQKFYAEYPYETDGIKYDLVFIDIDNIPELAIIPSDAHASGVIICVYNDGNVVETGRFGSFGKCRFNPYENLIYSTYMGQGEEESFFYRIEGTKSEELLALHSTPQYKESQYIGEYYEVDGTEVSEEAYKQVCEEWDREKLNIWGYDDAVSVNDLDDLYRELCGRLSCVKEQNRAEKDDSCLEEWERAYLAYMDAEEEYAAYCTYSLIYVDDDDIPELMIDTNSGAGGYLILTFHDSVLDIWRSDPNVTYIERGNLICNSGGKMGYYYDNVYAIQDGKWVYVDGGIHGDGPDGVQLDENGDYIEFFYWDEKEHWNGEEITEEEYEAHLNAIYPVEQSVCPQRYYILDEIRSILRTGDVVSAGHRYELIVEDVTWKEAWELCRKRGGYLATITSHEEFERLQERIISEDKADITFFVGANDERMAGNYFILGYRWLEPGNICYMQGLYHAFSEFWLEGEPGNTGFTESGVEVWEDYVVLFYQESDNRCYLGNVTNDIIEAAPSYAGRVGYICEYE